MDISRPAFAELVVESLRDAGFERLDYDPEAFALRGEFGYLTLSAPFERYRSASVEEGQAILIGLVKTAVTARDHHPPESWGEASPDVVPVIRPTRLHHQIDLLARADGRTNYLRTVSSPLAEGLNLELALDTPHATASVSPETLETWGVSEKSALEQAVDNLRNLAPVQTSSTESGFLIAHAADGHESARMATPEFFHRLGLSGHPVVIPAVRGAMLIAGANDGEALLGMAEAAQDLLEQERWIGFTPYVHDGEQWSRLVLDHTHPAAQAMRKLALMELREDYEAQRVPLGKLHEKTFISKLIVRDEDNTVRSFAAWGQGLKVLLPQADSYVFSLVDPDDPEEVGEMFDVPFVDVLEIVGDKLAVVENVEPLRYLAESFPDPEQIERLRDRAFNLHPTSHH
ncbi:MAG: hypothetical protein AAF654_14535 [Myxococcota bacterium]